MVITSKDYEYFQASFVDKKGDTIHTMLDTVLENSDIMSVFEVKYHRDSTLDATNGKAIMKFKVDQINLLTDHVPLIKSKDKNKQDFFDVVHQWPMYCAKADVEDYEILAGVIERKETFHQEYKIVSLKKEGSKWIRQKKEFTYEADFIEWVEPFSYGVKDNMPYIYFSTIERGAGSGSAGAATISLNLFDFYDLLSVRCEGIEKEENKIDCSFDESYAKLVEQGHSVAPGFFRHKIDECKLVYSYDEYGMDDPRNFIKKWELNNADVKGWFETRKNEQGKIEWSTYKQELYPTQDAHQKIENDSWIVYSFFRNSVIAYDKNSDEYFPLYAEGCNHGCDKSIDFDGENVVKITWTESSQENLQLSINLVNGEYLFAMNP